METPDVNNQIVIQITAKRVLRVYIPTLSGEMAHLDQARILVVDDLAAWRDQIRLLLAKHPEWRIVGEACDGQTAIEKAVELQPDIILLDIGMPVLTGIEAARIIRQKCPKSRILFVTQDGDVDIRNAAMAIGVAGYVQKSNVTHELLDAVATALLRDA